MLLASVAFFFSCEKQDVRLHTTIHEDGTCKREVIYRHVMPQEERDFLWGKDSTSAPLAPVPECVNMEGFMGSHTDIGENDTVTTTLEYREFKDVKEMCQYTPLQLNGARLKSNANLEKHFRWFYTEYTYTEAFNTVADTFKLSPTDYADKDVVSYWFTGQPNLLEGLSGGQASEKISKMEPFVTRWINDNLFKMCFDYMVQHYDSIQNPPVSKEQFVALHDSLPIALLKDGQDIANVDPVEGFEKFFHSNAYAPFFDEENPLGKGLREELAHQLNIFWFSVSYSLSMPGEVVNPGTGVLKDGIIYYPLTGERLIPGDYTITATSRVTNIWAYVVTFLILLIAIGSFIYQGKKRECRTVSR
jgi:hypothetical protein